MMQIIAAAMVILVAGTMSAEPANKSGKAKPSTKPRPSSKLSTEQAAAADERNEMAYVELRAKIYRQAFEMINLGIGEYHLLDFSTFRDKMIDADLKPESIKPLGREVLLNLGEILLFAGSEGEVILINDETPRWPFDVIEYKGKPCLVAHTAIMSTFNSLRMSNKQRVGQVFSSHAAPIVRSLFSSLPKTFQTVIISVTYGVRDFSKEDKSEPEQLLLTITRPSMEKYENGELTDEELAKASQIKAAVVGQKHSFVKVDPTFE